MRASRPGSLRLIFSRAAALLALVAQLAVGVAALGEARDGLGYASHIDPAGTSTHYVHDEALCAACQARSLHGVARVPHPPTVAPQPRQMATVRPWIVFVDSATPLQHLSRAPPAQTEFVS